MAVPSPYSESDLLPISALQHLIYCERQCALIPESGGVTLTESGRKIVLTAYQERKKDELMHPFIGEVAELGLFPHLQARLLARHLRGDHDLYPEFIWR